MPCDFQYLAVVTFIKEGGWQQSVLLGRGTFLENRGINSSSQPDGGEAYLWLQEEETPGRPVSGHGGAGVPWHPGDSPACCRQRVSSMLVISKLKAGRCVHASLSHPCSRLHNLPLCQLPGCAA